MSWDRGAPTPVVPNSDQARMNPDKGPPWMCPCGKVNVSKATHCMKCSALRPEEKMLRQQARMFQGLGRGGGYFERAEATQRNEAEEEEDEFDVFGRRKRGRATASGGGREAPAAVESAGDAAVEQGGAAPSIPSTLYRCTRQSDGDYALGLA
ncbi:unnamed protein product [Prorocentrum cordatum]|uniref:RanBP2-type domain-containing protein n=1 Tax=Prorocentrum cordatum TaxID=2364126 RepID=A0ABN9U1P2_9DINO|nr:unnamed protein product [Polarella glacialis]